jgi:hypothetical protein
MPVHQPAGKKERTMGRRFDGCKDEGLPVAEALARRSVRVRPVDWREHLRHSSVIALRDDKKATDVHREAHEQ